MLRAPGLNAFGGFNSFAVGNPGLNVPGFSSGLGW
jgi:hypothetical protein